MVGDRRREWDFPVHKGFHAGQDDQRVLEALARLDELDDRSQSELMKESILMFEIVEDVFNEFELELEGPPKRHLLRQALKTGLTRELMDD